MGLCGFIENQDVLDRAAGTRPAVFDADEICVRRGQCEDRLFEVGQPKRPPKAQKGKTAGSIAKLLMAHTKRQLVGMCKTAGIVLGGRENKAAIVSLLTESEDANGD